MGVQTERSVYGSSGLPLLVVHAAACSPGWGEGAYTD